ncbi:Ig-like domain-containing protein [Pontibacter fetidus]|uniref:T9SS type B sorting domain-containing protein n=1 Tax=Pontibacter fetidus TaxID=2700082 RepID=A0A6B2GYL9_9BACT|nr:gliding motility-associated C-terminal domain-containing protein [Pontibacter fetidus]NDK54958.1 T9SS type B sorting domain-containing protein [Pontibacter fetidus]
MRLPLLTHIYWPLLLLCLLFSKTAVAQTQPACQVTIDAEGSSSLCQGESVTLRAVSSNQLSSFQWFLNGAPLAGQTNATISVSIAGDYTVRVSGATCQAATSTPFQVTVSPRPANPSFLVTPTTTQCAGTPLAFQVNAPQPDIFYTWIFGDGGSAKGDSVGHTYTDKGINFANYNVKVIATSAQGCQSDTVTQQVRVARMPEAAFADSSDFQTCLPDTIEDDEIKVFAYIENKTVEPYLSDIRTYIVNWGDGGPDVQYTRNEFPIKNPNPYTKVGDYPITIRAVASNGCEFVFEQNYNVSKEPKANFTLSKQPAATPSSCLPVIVALGDSSTGGNLTYKWTVQPSTGFTIEFGGLDQDTLSLLFTESGIYQIELIVENGCDDDTTSQSVVVGWPQVQLPPDTTSCGPIDFKYTTGAIPGTGNVFVDPNLGKIKTAVWTVVGPTGGTRTLSGQNQTIRFTEEGVHEVTLTVENECGSSEELAGTFPVVQRITILPIPEAPTIQDITVCSGDSVTLEPTGPGGNYNFYDAAGTLLSTGPSYTTTGITQTTDFTVETIGDNDCPSERVPVKVTVVPPLANNTIQGDQSLCQGDAPAPLTGSTPTGGTGGGYIYTWLSSTSGPDGGFVPAAGVNNDVNYTPQPLIQRTWFRRLITVASCSPDTSNAVLVNAVPKIQNNTISAAQDICEGQQPATLVGTRVTGGDGAVYEFRWEVSTEGPGTGFVPAPGNNTSENYSPGVLTQASWFRRVVTSAGCVVFSEPVMIDIVPPLDNNTIASAQTICAGSTPTPLTGSAPTGGSGPYTYLWESSITSATGGFSPAAGTNNGQSYTPGNLKVNTWFRRTVTSQGCEADVSEAILITVNQAVTNNSIGAPQTICAGDVPAALTGTTPNGGSGTYTYLWQSSISGPDSGFGSAAGTNTGINYTPQALTQNTWFRRVVDSQGCKTTSEPVLITVNPRPSPPILTVKDATTCPGGSATLSIQNPNGGIYQWFADATGGEPVFEGPVFRTPNLTQPTTYYVEAVNTNGCSSATRTTVAVRIVEPVADAGQDVTIIQGKTVELRATGGDTYVWEPAESLSNPNVANPVARPNETTTYRVTVSTEEGCTATDEVTITVIPAIVVPNAFTPNRDNVNEVWEIQNIENYPDVRVEIFNRWGNIVFTSNGYGTPWDGTLNGEDLPVATYYYMIYLNKSEKPISGNVTIIR